MPCQSGRVQLAAAAVLAFAWTASGGAIDQGACNTTEVIGVLSWLAEPLADALANVESDNLAGDSIINVTLGATHEQLEAVFSLLLDGDSTLQFSTSASATSIFTSSRGTFLLGNQGAHNTEAQLRIANTLDEKLTVLDPWIDHDGDGNPTFSFAEECSNGMEIEPSGTLYCDFWPWMYEPVHSSNERSNGYHFYDDEWGNYKAGFTLVDAYGTERYWLHIQQVSWKEGPPNLNDKSTYYTTVSVTLGDFSGAEYKLWPPTMYVHNYQKTELVSSARITREYAWNEKVQLSSDHVCLGTASFAVDLQGISGEWLEPPTGCSQ